MSNPDARHPVHVALTVNQALALEELLVRSLQERLVPTVPNRTIIAVQLRLAMGIASAGLPDPPPPPPSKWIIR